MNLNSSPNPSVPKKEEILQQLDTLYDSLNAYLLNWKKTDGGTKGHAIGSAIKNSEKLKQFFKQYC